MAEDCLRFSSDTPPLAEQSGFEAYHDLYAPVADTRAVANDFAVAVEAQRLGDLILFDRKLRSVRHDRSAKRVARNGFDHFTAQLALSGAFAVSTEAGDRVVRPGDVALIDMDQPMTTLVQDARSLTLSIPRAAMETIEPDPARLHGAVLPSGCSSMLEAVLTSFLSSARPHGTGDRARISRVAIELLALALSGHARDEAADATLSQSATEAVCRAKARRAIDANLRADPDGIARAVGRSRSALYRAFQPTGGVARYIRTRRLARLRALLSEPGEARKLAELADLCGFSSDSDCVRAFRNAYGMTPGEFRAEERATGPSHGRPDQQMARWWNDMR